METDLTRKNWKMAENSAEREETEIIFNKMEKCNKNWNNRELKSSFSRKKS